MEQVFQKPLTLSDINHRLCFPTKHLDRLPPFPPGENEVEFAVRYGDDGPVYKFWCVKRKKGGHLKPTIDRGWSDLVRDHKQLQVGDWLRFYEGGQHDPPRFQVEVWRRQLEYSDDYGETWNWIRI